MIKFRSQVCLNWNVSMSPWSLVFPVPYSEIRVLQIPMKNQQTVKEWG